MANQSIESSISSAHRSAMSQNRQVEHTQIQQDVVKNANNINDNQNGEMNLSQDEMIKKTKDVTDKLNYQMEQLDTNVRFSYNEKINAMVVQVTEQSTGKVIRQLPSEQAIKISEYFKESIGLLFDKES